MLRSDQRRDPRVPRGRFPAQRTGRMESQRYLSAILAWMRPLHAATRREILGTLRDGVATATSNRALALDDLERRALAIEAEFAQRSTAAALDAIATRASLSVDQLNAREIARQFRAAISISPDTAIPDGRAILRGWVAENAELIQTIPQAHVREVRRIVRAGYQIGERHETIAKQIQGRFRVEKRRAKLIARDQVNKLNGELTRERHSRAGVDQFIWRTSLDERVRAVHRDAEGEIYNWKDGHPTERFPGHPINCRCTAEPVVRTTGGDVLGPLGGTVDLSNFPADLGFARTSGGPRRVPSKPVKVSPARSRVP